MNNKPTKKEKEWLLQVKSQPCSVCDAPPPSEAHHVKQHYQYTCIALCVDCHRGSSGWHGTKVMWKIKKMDELMALNQTIKNIFEGGSKIENPF